VERQHAEGAALVVAQRVGLDRAGAGGQDHLESGPVGEDRAARDVVDDDGPACCQGGGAGGGLTRVNGSEVAQKLVGEAPGPAIRSDCVAASKI